MVQLLNANNTSGIPTDNQIFTTINQVTNISLSSVYYLVRLTSLSSLNSVTFIPSSVDMSSIPRFIILNFTILESTATPDPVNGSIKLYDDTGKLDTFPMGFYSYEIFEQSSSTNLDPSTLPTSAKKEVGTAFIRDFFGSMKELQDGFTEYDPTTTQYVYPS